MGKGVKTVQYVIVVVSTLFLGIMSCGAILAPRIEAEMLKSYQLETQELKRQIEIIELSRYSEPSDDIIAEHINAGIREREMRSTLFRAAVIGLLFVALISTAVIAYRVVNRLLAPYLQRVTFEANKAQEEVHRVQQANAYQPQYRHHVRRHRPAERPRSPFHQP